MQEEKMKRNVILMFLVSFVVAGLSGCILSSDPTPESPVTLNDSEVIDDGTCLNEGDCPHSAEEEASSENTVSTIPSGAVTFAWTWYAGGAYGKPCHAHFGPKNDAYRQSCGGDNRRWELILQGDSNLVLYDCSYYPRRWIWNSGTNGYPFDALLMQDDGNLVIYPAGCPIVDYYHGLRLCQTYTPAYWASQTYKKPIWPNTKFLLQYDGNLVIYSNQTAIWATMTNGGRRSYCNGGGCRLY
jgi:hypothetical protein